MSQRIAGRQDKEPFMGLSIVVPSTLVLVATGSLTALYLVGRPEPGSETAAPPARAASRSPQSTADVRIKLAEAPEVVRVAALRVIDETSITKVVRAADDGLITYEVHFVEHGDPGSRVFSPAGDVVRVEHAVPRDRLPAAASAALHKAYPDANVTVLSVVSDTYYQVEVVADGKKRELKINAAGKIDAGESSGLGSRRGPDPSVIFSKK